MEKFLDLAGQLKSRLASASTLEDLAAVKAAFDTEFAAAYKVDMLAEQKAREIAAAEAAAAEAQANLAKLKGE